MLKKERPKVQAQVLEQWAANRPTRMGAVIKQLKKEDEREIKKSIVELWNPSMIAVPFVETPEAKQRFRALLQEREQAEREEWMKREEEEYRKDQLKNFDVLTSPGEKVYGIFDSMPRKPSTKKAKAKGEITLL